MPRLGGLLLFGLLALVASACTGGAAADQARPSSTPTPAHATATTEAIATTPAPIVEASPVAAEAARRSGEPAIDRVIEAVEQRDVATLRALTALQSVPCVATQEGLGGPPLCEQGEPEGTIVDVFPAAYCEGVLDRFPATVLGQFAAAARGLYAVAAGPDEPRAEPYWPVGDHFLVFHMRSTAGMHAGRLVIEDGAIVMAWFGCPGTPEEVASWRGERLPLIAGPFAEPEPERPPLTPTTGIAGVDAVIAAMAEYNLGALIERTKPGEQPCVAEVGDAPDVECHAAKGEAPGDLVAALPVAHCEGTLTRDIARAHRALLSHAPALYAVVEAPADEPDHPVWRRGDYYLAYTLHDERGATPAVRLTVDREGQILVIWYGCGSSAEELMEHNEERLPVVLPPLR